MSANDLLKFVTNLFLMAVFSDMLDKVTGFFYICKAITKGAIEGCVPSQWQCLPPVMALQH